MKALELVGNILGYIPGVSAVVGVIKGFVYLSKVKECEKERANMTITAQKIDEEVVHKIAYPWGSINILDKKIETYKSLMIYCFCEFIPIMNFGLAAAETYSLLELDSYRIHDEPDEVIIDLVQRNGVILPPPDQSAKREFSLKVLRTLDNLDIEGFVSYQKDEKGNDPKTIKTVYNQVLLKRQIYTNLLVNWKEGNNAIERVRKELQDQLEFINNPDNIKIPPKPEKLVNTDDNTTYLNEFKNHQYYLSNANTFKASIGIAIKKLDEAILAKSSDKSATLTPGLL